jgi:hypothetical protein
MEERNSKSEIRNSKQIRIFEMENPKQETAFGFGHLPLDHSKLFRISPKLAGPAGAMPTVPQELCL